LPADDVAHAIRLATGGLVPDVTLVLEPVLEWAGPGNGPRAKSRTGSSRQDDAFHRRVLDAYRRAAGPAWCTSMRHSPRIRAGRRVARGHGGDRTLNTRRLMKLRNVVIVTAVAGLALATGGWLLQRQAEPTGSVYQQARLFEDVLAHVADFYVDSIEERRLYQMAIDGMLDQLHDPYSVFLKRDDFGRSTRPRPATTAVWASRSTYATAWIHGGGAAPRHPAESARGFSRAIRSSPWTAARPKAGRNDQAVKQLRGEPGSGVELKVRRVGVDGSLAFKLTRATIHIRSVQVSMMLDDKVGYVLLTPVSETSAQELTDALNGLIQKGMKSLVARSAG